ncbi:peptidylprolyl isomerase [Oceanobacillus sp. 1P07AA]|uniref:peptidylprolyl isomerase n=1 Tax=Oceanobacillus sp. 1P07AA TaxID=3132293 RepID=UPI0039A5D93E
MQQRYLFILMLMITLLLSACSDTEETPSVETQSDENPIATITMENGQTITVELYPDIAPNTVTNFISLIEDGFYDGLTFHRIVPEFVIQGGDPEGNGTGGPEYSIPGEFTSNGFENNLVHERGVLSMARSQHPDSAGSQFFIVLDKADHLDEDYAGFGKVTEGMETVDNIVEQGTSGEKVPTIKQITVDTKGQDYGEPEKTE